MNYEKYTCDQYFNKVIPSTSTNTSSSKTTEQREHTEKKQESTTKPLCGMDHIDLTASVRLEICAIRKLEPTQNIN